jgi:hypothetical protein
VSREATEVGVRWASVPVRPGVVSLPGGVGVGDIPGVNEAHGC